MNRVRRAAHAALVVSITLYGCAGLYTDIPLPPVAPAEIDAVAQSTRPLTPQELEVRLRRSFYGILYDESGEAAGGESRTDFIARQIADESVPPTYLVSVTRDQIRQTTSSPDVADLLTEKLERAQAVLQRRLERVGQRVATAAGRSDLQFHLDPALIINAGTPKELDSTRVLVGPQLILLLESEAALAFVLGHEIAHITMEHTTAGAIQTIVVGTLQVAAMAAVLVAATAAREQGERGMSAEQLHDSMALAATVTGLLANGLVAASGFTRDQEREADYYGVLYMTQAGYPAEGAAVAAHQMLAYEHGAGSSFQVPFLASHPTTAERIVRLGKWSDSLAARNPSSSPRNVLETVPVVAMKPDGEQPLPRRVDSAPLDQETADAEAIEREPEETLELDADQESCWDVAGTDNTLCTTCCSGNECDTRCEPRTAAVAGVSATRNCWNVDALEADTRMICTTCCSGTASCATKCAAL